jgi:FkbM family methyltransferase
MMHELGVGTHAAWYHFWAAYTAAQAHNTGRPRRAISRRVVSYFKEICQLVEPTVTLELGAHEAGFSEWSRLTFPEARCVALEANPYVHREHRKRLDDLGVEYHHLAAAATNGSVTIKIPTTVRGHARGRRSKMASLVMHRDAAGYEDVEVEAVRVDDFLELSDDDRLVAWVDVEGASGVVLPGAEKVMTRAAGIYIEVERDDRWPGQWRDVDVARFFEDVGKVPALRDVQRTNQYNVVFLDAALATVPDVVGRAASVLRPPRISPPAESAGG